MLHHSLAAAAGNLAASRQGCSVRASTITHSAHGMQDAGPGIALAPLDMATCVVVHFAAGRNKDVHMPRCCPLSSTC